MANPASDIEIEVAYALPDKQKILQIAVAAGTSVKIAALNAGIEKHFAGLDVATAPLGIFGKLIAKPTEHVVKEGDRIEIYRPLLADPKASRIKRAEKKSS
ncbi:MAG TPA: RnfH family protein [Marinospirillum sp.]|uniref:RnfH family protein n=1 Tax=Marinospirillum sp. TaxID=2183934 RepID=UPI002B49CA88|nr:RnfH family protein [Marinospirillum sp.]HKM14530.1 RnfH family protein [Marinospirillum sp.]